MTPEETAELIRLKKLETDERRSPTEKMACEAWDRVKKPADAAFVDLPMEMQHKLIDLAEKALAGQQEAEGDYAPAGFFAKVRALSGITFPAPSPAGEPVKVNTVGGPITVHGAGEPVVLQEGESAEFGSERATHVRSGPGHVDTEISKPEPEETLLKGRLPDDFPYRAALATAEINTYHQLRKRLESGEHIPGIGPAAEAKIAERLANPE